MVNIPNCLAEVNNRIARAAKSAGRDPSSIRLVAVSKRQPTPAIRSAYAAGIRDFGENYVQELAQKAKELADLPDLRFHMIGHLQRNKVRHVVQAASIVHTVDSPELARELDKRALDCPIPEARRLAIAGRSSDERLSVLVEVNVGGETQKSGCEPENLPAVLDALEACSHLRLLGLMTVPPFTDQAEDSRPYFEQLVALREQQGGPARLPELSMGMTLDLEVAIAAGATMVRVGTALFGERPPREELP
jgi:hypothetical protein